MQPKLKDKAIVNIRIITDDRYYNDDHLTVSIFGNELKLEKMNDRITETFRDRSIIRNYRNYIQDEDNSYCYSHVYEKKCCIKIQSSRIFIIFSELTYLEDDTLVKIDGDILRNVDDTSNPLFFILRSHLSSYPHQGDGKLYEYRSTCEEYKVLIILSVCDMVE